MGSSPTPGAPGNARPERAFGVPGIKRPGFAIGGAWHAATAPGKTAGPRVVRSRLERLRLLPAQHDVRVREHHAPHRACPHGRRLMLPGPAPPTADLLERSQPVNHAARTRAGHRPSGHTLPNVLRGARRTTVHRRRTASRIPSGPAFVSAVAGAAGATTAIAASTRIRAITGSVPEVDCLGASMRRDSVRPYTRLCSTPRRYALMADPKRAVERHFEAFNARDTDAAPWSDDAEVVAPNASVHGRDEVLGFLAVFWDAFPTGVSRWWAFSPKDPSSPPRAGSSARTPASCARRQGTSRPRDGRSTSAGCRLPGSRRRTGLGTSLLRSGRAARPARTDAGDLSALLPEPR